MVDRNLSCLGMAVLSINTRSISPDLCAARAKKFERIDRMLSVLEEETGNVPFIVVLQETWLDPTQIGTYAEEGMPLLSSDSSSNYPCLVSDKIDPLGQTRGRGLMIIVHPLIISWISRMEGKQVVLQKVDHVTVRSFEVLAGYVGPIFIVSVYVKHNPDRRPDSDHLVETIRRLKPPHCTHVIVGGDFNYRTHWDGLRGLFEGQLGLISTVDERGITSTHNRGNVLDHVLVSSQVIVRRVQAISWEYSDHSMVRVDIDLDVAPNSSSNSSKSKQPPERVNIGKFRKIMAEVSREKPPPSVEHVELVESFMQEVEDMVGQMEEEEEEEDIDLGVLNSRLLDIAVDSFGSSKPRPRIQKAFMYDKKVREAAKQRRISRKTYNKAADGNKEQAKVELDLANKRWEKVRRSAQRQQEEDLARAIERGDVSIFWSLFRKSRTARPADSCNSKLSPDDAVQFYRTLFSDPETARLIRETIPSGEQSKVVQVSDDEVITALNQTRDCASGPDGVHPILLRHCKDQLAPILARLYTKCLTEGIPSVLRAGTIKLIAKTFPPSSDPALYRPITLLPSIIRVMMRVLDNKIRDLIERGVIKVPIEQGGFLKDRSTGLQTFALLLIRDWAKQRGWALYVAFLDIEKAFDSINHLELLEVLRAVGVPPEIVDAIHRLLPYFELEIFGRLFPQDKGTFQGSPLSPLLCVLFLIDFIEYINDNNEGFGGVEIPVDVQQMIRALLFADDIVLVARSIDQLKVALRLAGRWAERRKVRYGHGKCKVMRLARDPSDRSTREELEVVELQGHPLDWVHEYKHLGHIIVEAPEYGKRRERIIPVDEKKVRGLCYAMAKAFPSTARYCHVAPLSIRLGVRQVIHAKYLYPTALIDTDYQTLDVEIRRSLKYMLGLPPNSSSAQLHADLGIWPSEYYADQRAMRMAGRLAYRYWTQGEEHRSRPKFIDSKAKDGVVARIGDILWKYRKTWKDVYEFGHEEGWSKTVLELLGRRFAAYCQQAAEQYDHPILAYSGVPAPQPRIKRALRFGGELAVAAIRMRSPSLRLRPAHDHGLCRYCKEGRENGRHLLECNAIPEDLWRTREAFLEEIRCGDTSRIRVIDNALSFNWRLMENEQLKRLLVWCRNMINRYASYVPEWELVEAPELAAYPVRRVRPQYS